MSETKEIKKDDFVTVYGTGKFRTMPAGSVHRLHKVAAKNLIAKDAATVEKPKAKESK